MSFACKWDLIIMGGLKQASLANAVFLSMTKAKACWRVILTGCLKNWMQKTKINDLSIVYHGKYKHIPWWKEPYHT